MGKQITRALVLLPLILVMSLPGSLAQGGPATYYVDTDGDDANPGTIADPWRTVQYAVNQVQPGDTVIVRSGTYTESVNLTISGQAGLPITLTAYRDETVTINGDAAPALHSEWNGVQWWIIDGLVLESAYTRTLELSMWDSFWSDHMVIRSNLIRGAAYVGGSFNLFEGNEVDGTGLGLENGVVEETENSHHNLYRNNNIHDFTRRCLWSMHLTHDSVFEYNEIHDSDDMGLDLDGYGSVEWGHVVQGNEFYAIEEYPLEIENAYATAVLSNTIHDVPRRGITIINYGDGYCMADPGGLYGDIDGNGDCRDNPTGSIISGNVIQNVPGHSAIINWNTGGLVISDNTINCSGYAWGILLDCGEFCQDIKLRDNSIVNCNWGGIHIKDPFSGLVVLVDRSE